ncbi:5340_t:CDS:1 [Paraglomus brasilianum]|uniref:5340_t:CDS:1 n=1 Tax=Paraglomus brasilianum TaxID=144538 RepID=A0A9N9ADI6_9GLOM|nr:5340_t:CDS:1 [Paraglomus brasilianum]
MECIHSLATRFQTVTLETPSHTPYSLDHFPNELLFAILSYINPPNKLWILRRVNKRWKLICQRITYTITRNYFESRPTCIQMIVCGIARTVSYHDKPISMNMKGMTDEGRIVFEIKTAKQTFRLYRKSKLALAIRRKCYASGVQPSSKEHRDLLRLTTKHSINSPLGYVLEYSTSDNRDMSRTREFFWKDVSVLHFAATPALIMTHSFYEETSS